MLVRVLALLVALCLCVPAFAAQAQAGSTAAPAGHSHLDAGAGGDALQPLTGGVADEHPLDEPPGQSPCEGAMDSPALMMARPDAKAPLLSMSRPHPYAVAAWCAPYLDGPQRPPCAKRVSA